MITNTGGLVRPILSSKWLKSLLSVWTRLLSRCSKWYVHTSLWLTI
ncbi:unnamed protein product [Gulo gulo]|uniref:Uncharacterized protein n=1 Tax=Gulo gulo TaxID=48420 RepID=A0A9X9Q0C0_GULGU|nr:unnamed protein product [Gulo gulo]